jgi:hypothetical protein
LLATTLAGRGNLDEAEQVLRAHADDLFVSEQLIKLLFQRGNLDQAEQILRSRLDLGYGDAELFAQLLTGRGRPEEAKRLRRFGLNPDGSIANPHGQLASRGHALRHHAAMVGGSILVVASHELIRKMISKRFGRNS